MTLFVDTSVWSLALRRDQIAEALEVERLARALGDGAVVVVTGLVLPGAPPGVPRPSRT